MSKKILGLDLGSNSIGWALLEGKSKTPSSIAGLGCRIFTKAVEAKIPTPKNVKRRNMRSGRRIIQRRARRKQRMLNYLVSLNLLPKELQDSFQPEVLLNEIGSPYKLRAKGLDKKLSPNELGRVLLHFVARRGFLSSKKQIAGDLVDDPDTIEYLAELDSGSNEDKEETAFKADITELREAIKKSKARTLGEYLHKLKQGECKRNRSHDGGHLRTDRKMYQDELQLIWKKQKKYFGHLPDNFMEDKKGVKQIIFYQRPLKLKKNLVGRCSLEPKKYRANIARLEVQRFRYLQDINNLAYSDKYSEKWFSLDDKQKIKLISYFENHPKITTAKLKKELCLNKSNKINLEEKNLKGNITACEIRTVLNEKWDKMSDDKQRDLFEDLLTIKKKSVLKNRLINHWSFDKKIATKLCLLEFEPSHSNHSLKAIKKILPYLENGMIYSDARQAAGYKFDGNDSATSLEIGEEKLSAPPETSNPIVNKGLHELKRVVNAIIKKYGKPDAIRIEMARDLEMNTKRYQENQKKQKENQKANEEAQEAFAELNLGKRYASRDDKIKYRLWKDQKELCAYSTEYIALQQVFSADTEIDHILPYTKSLDDSYMNKVLCFARENREKSNRTPIDKWGTDSDKWSKIKRAISKWDKSLETKKSRFYQTEDDLQKRDFISNQLNDTRYISKVARKYVEQLGCDISVTKGFVVSEIRHQWGFNTLIGETDTKERTDHRHHAIDAVVIAATSRSLYQKAVDQIQQDKLKIEPPYKNIREELAEKLKHTIVSHAPQRKISGGLHEETGAGYVKKHGGLVYRKALTDLNTKTIDKIIDEIVKKNVKRHISKFKSIKEAFSNSVVYHEDGKTPIKRVRILQSSTNKKKLEQTKFGVKDKQGNIFKWMAYGNNHHVEIIRNKQTEKIKGEFVTMMHASHRARGINIPKQPIIKVDHGADYEFIMAMHINDTVSIENENGECIFYRIQKLDSSSNKIMLRLATATTLSKEDEKLHLNINKENFDKYKIQLRRINAIGFLIND